MVQPTTHFGYWYSVLLLGFEAVQHVTVLSTLGDYNTMVFVYLNKHNRKA